VIGSILNRFHAGVPMSDADTRRGRRPYGSSRHVPFQPGDEQATYTREQLVQFDSRFRARLLRAFQDGLESRRSAAGLCVPPATDNEPFHILTAHRRASRYRDLAGITASTP
jgi:hypothetical protein